MIVLDQASGLSSLSLIMRRQQTTCRRVEHRTLPPLYPSDVSAAFENILFYDSPSENALSKNVHAQPWERLVPAIIDHGLSGVALRYLAETREAIPPAALTCLRSAHFASSASTRTLILQAGPPLAALALANIPCVVIKGPGIALHSQLGERPFSDLDILVARRHFTAALTLLNQQGFRESPSTVFPWPSFDLHCREAVNLHSKEGGSIDLHHTVAPWLWTQHLNVDHLIASAVTAFQHRTTLPVLPPELNFLVACLHIFSDKSSPGRSLRVWRDIVTLAKVCEPERLAREVARARLAGWVTWVLGSLPHSYQPQQLLSAIAPLPQDIPSQGRLSLLLPPHRVGTHHFAHALRLPTTRGLLFLGGLVVPSQDFRRERLAPDKASIIGWWRSAPSRYRAEAYRALLSRMDGR